MKHYHVFFGCAGCLPDSQERFGTRTDALEYAASLAEEEEEDGMDVSQIGEGLYSIEGGIKHIEVVPCAEDCPEDY